WLERWRTDQVTGLEVWRERRFAVVIGNDLMNGTFDRVVLGYDAAGKLVRADILDFKTDRLADDLEREERRGFYQPQLEAYARALGRLTGLDAGSIQTELVWIN
ncbi:MAG TPA: PD-(D/E)XK nuclease family protein, partial [Candidatus Methylacidiphilales bacterium]